MTLLSWPSVLQQFPASDFSSKEQYSVVTGKVCKRQRGEMGRCVGRVGGPPGTAGMLGAARTAPCTAQGGAGWGQEAHWVSVHSPQRFPGTAGSTHKLKRNRYGKMDIYIYLRSNWMQMLNLVDWICNSTILSNYNNGLKSRHLYDDTKQVHTGGSIWSGLTSQRQLTFIFV